MINFVFPKNNDSYNKLLTLLTNPIIKHLNKDEYIISNVSKDNCINLHFFNERYYLNIVKNNGINVFMAHGVSDKNYRDRMLKTDFNYVIVTGTLWKQKFIEKYKFDESQIFIGGYTKFDDYFNNVNIINNIVKNIVWLPTHNMFPNHSPKVSTYPFFKDYINYIPDKYNFIESLHPANDSKHNSSYDVIINADVVLGGFSGALYEALLLNKPVIFLDWLVEEYILLRFKESFEYDIYKNKIGYHASNINEVVELIEVALQNGVKKETKEFINGILSPELNGKSGITIAEFLKKIDKEYYV